MLHSAKLSLLKPECIYVLHQSWYDLHCYRSLQLHLLLRYHDCIFEHFFLLCWSSRRYDTVQHLKSVDWKVCPIIHHRQFFSLFDKRLRMLIWVQIYEQTYIVDYDEYSCESRMLPNQNWFHQCTHLLVFHRFLFLPIKPNEGCAVGEECKQLRFLQRLLQWQYTHMQLFLVPYRFILIRI